MSGRGGEGGGRTGQRGGQPYRGRGRSGGASQQNYERFSGEPQQNYRNGRDPQQHHYRNGGDPQQNHYRNGSDPQQRYNRNAGDPQQYHPRDDDSRGRGFVNPNPNPPQSFSAAAASSSFSYASITQRNAERAESSSSMSSSSLALQLEQRLKLEAEEHKPSPQQKQQATPSSSKAIVLPDRPGFGQIGTPCMVKANHFFIQLSGNCNFHHYDVSIAPEVISKAKNRAVMKQLVDLYKKSHLGNRLPVYDGMKSLYTAGPLPFVSLEFQINLVDSSGQQTATRRRENTFTVTIRLVGRPDLHHMLRDAPQEALQVLDVVLRESSSQKYNARGRSFFSPYFGRPVPMDGGLECWRGFHQSVRPTQRGLSLNIDVKATSFFQPISVVDFVCQLLNRDTSRPLSDRDRLKVKKALRNVKVQADYGVRRQYRVTGITAVPTNQLMFLGDNRLQMSVVQYYKDTHNITLKHTNWPSLQAGNGMQLKYLPMEVFKIVGGQRYPLKLNERQVTAMLGAACKRPVERERQILQILETNNYNNDGYAKEFGIQVRNQFASVEARLLPTPTLKYKNTACTPEVGSWNMMRKSVVNGATIDNWACLNFSRLASEAVDRFCCELTRMCTVSGMNFRQNPVFPLAAVPDTEVDLVLKRLHANAMSKLGKGLDLLLVILPENGSIYGRLKKVCETELEILTQCCLPKNIIKLSPQFLANIGLKINAKTGGRNAVLNDFMTKAIPGITDKPTIIFGADVTHPHPGEDSTPSIAAVVASQDWPEITKYRCLLSTQEQRKEIIRDLYKEENDPKRGLVRGGMIQELIRSFADATKRLPSRIIFYRDGVSEGQFNQVLEEELLAIQKACASIRDGYRPTVTFVVVQKRHNTRLLPFNHGDRNWQDRSGNILPGTVVDTGICHPSQFDFYLCSHSGIQGTSRPTHYHVLWDENQFTADSLQTLTYNMCYTYVRCTRSVSLVPAAYYAHHAAFRARFYLEETSESGSSAGQGSSIVQPLPEIKERLKKGMFYI